MENYKIIEYGDNDIIKFVNVPKHKKRSHYFRGNWVWREMLHQTRSQFILSTTTIKIKSPFNYHKMVQYHNIGAHTFRIYWEKIIEKYVPITNERRHPHMAKKLFEC